MGKVQGSLMWGGSKSPAYHIDYATLQELAKSTALECPLGQIQLRGQGPSATSI